MRSIVKFAFLNKEEKMTTMKRFDLLKFFLFLLFSFMNLSILGVEDPGGLYFVSRYIGKFSRFVAKDKFMEYFRDVYQEEEVFIYGPKAGNYDFSVLKGKKLKCFAAFVDKKSKFEVDMLKDMPLEILDLSFVAPRKLSELQPLFTSSLKELYLSRVILDEPSLLSSLQLETLVLDGLTYSDDIMTNIAQMKSLKRLGLRFYYKDKSDGLWKWRNDIPFVILNNLSLTALNLEYVTPTILYFLEKQKQLRILKINVGPQFSIRYLLSSIAGREFDFLAMNWLSKPDQRKLKDLLREYHVKAKVLFVNGKQVIPENDNEEKRLEQVKSAGIE